MKRREIEIHIQDADGQSVFWIDTMGRTRSPFGSRKPFDPRHDYYPGSDEDDEDDEGFWREPILALIGIVRGLNGERIIHYRVPGGGDRVRRIERDTDDDRAARIFHDLYQCDGWWEHYESPLEESPAYWGRPVASLLGGRVNG